MNFLSFCSPFPMPLNMPVLKVETEFDGLNGGVAGDIETQLRDEVDA